MTDSVKKEKKIMSQQQPKPPPPSTPQKSSVSTSVVKKELSNSDLGIPDLPSLEFTSIFKSVKKGVKTGVKTAVKAGKLLCFSRFQFVKLNNVESSQMKIDFGVPRAPKKSGFRAFFIFF